VAVPGDRGAAYYGDGRRKAACTLVTMIGISAKRVPPDGANKLHAVHTRHAQIEEDHVERDRRSGDTVCCLAD